MSDIRVAILSPYAWGIPRFGGQSRVFEIAKSLGEGGIKVDMNTYEISENVELRNVEVHIWSELYGLWAYYPVTLRNTKRLVRRTWHTLKSVDRFRQSDIIISSLLNTAWHGIVLGEIIRRPIILDEHNVEWLLAYQLGLKAKYNWRILRTYEKICLRNFDQVAVTSKVDLKMLENLGVSDSKLSIVPNGVDCSIFLPNKRQRDITRERYSINERPTVLFMGSFGYFPNVDAAQTIIKEIYPRVRELVPNILFMLIGREVDQLVIPTCKDFLIPGLVDDVPSHINASDICIAPLRYGSGTRIKILEWMASGKVVIATSKAAEGLDVVHGEDIIIENDVNKYPFWIAKLLAEPELKEKIEGNARALILKKYDWKSCILPMVEAIKGVLP